MDIFFRMFRFPFKIISNKNILPLLIILFFTSLAARHLIFEQGYFMMHDDLQMMRQLEMEKCFKDNQIPCRWTPDMAYGYGYAMFNFYPPLPYLIGQVIRTLGFSFVETVKVTFALSLFLSGIFMYFLAKEFFGRLGGILSAVFYVWAPYRSVDIFVRGAMNESWAMTWFPLIFFAAYKLIQGRENNKSKISKIALKNIIKTQFSGNNLTYVLLLALSFSFLLMSHNLMVMIFTPVLILFVAVNILIRKVFYKIIPLSISALWALGMASFFTLPAIFENKLTHVSSALEGYYNYAGHFVSISQLLFSRYWGYGPSVWGTAEDRMPFQIGHLHWFLSLCAALIILVLLVKNVSVFKKYLLNNHLILITSLMIFIGWFSAFMAHQRSFFIWRLLPPLSYLQFPWRFLTITTFALSFVVGFLPGIFSRWKNFKVKILRFLITPCQLLFVLVVCFVLVIFNWKYFRPDGGKLGKISDKSKFTDLAWDLQRMAGLYDYLPITAITAPNGPRPSLTEVMKGEVQIDKISEGSYWILFNANVLSDASDIRINILDFPKWRVFVNGVENEKFIPKEELFGRFWITLPKGQHKVYAQIFNTPIRTLSNVLSLTSILGFIIILFRKPLFGGKI